MVNHDVMAIFNNSVVTPLNSLDQYDHFCLILIFADNYGISSMDTYFSVALCIIFLILVALNWGETFGMIVDSARVGNIDLVYRV